MNNCKSFKSSNPSTTQKEEDKKTVFVSELRGPEALNFIRAMRIPSTGQSEQQKH